MGKTHSRVEKVLGASFPEHERYFGFENFGNTCYFNSVLQALFFCPAFRECVLSCQPRLKERAGGETLLSHLVELYDAIASNKKKTGVIAPRPFFARLKQDNVLFNSTMQQDAQEFLNFLLNTISEQVAELERDLGGSTPSHGVGAINGSSGSGNGSGSGEGRGRSVHGHGHQRSHHPGHESAMNGHGLPLPGASENGSSISSNSNSNNNSNSNGNHNGSGGGKAKLNGGPDHSSGPGGATGTAVAGATFSASVSAAGLSAGTMGSDFNQQSSEAAAAAAAASAQQHVAAARTWVHSLFEGTLTSETRCLNCETVTTRQESFLDLSVDIEQNTSISSCLRNFSSTETLHNDCKYFCETCCSEQEAQKCMRVRKLPTILALHLKRFKYVERLQRNVKLSYRVVYPFELRLFNTTDDAECPDRIYDLFAVVVHIGPQPNRGHYISLVKSVGRWLIFDDEDVGFLDEGAMEGFFGLTDEQLNSRMSCESAYILFYQARDAQ